MPSAMSRLAPPESDSRRVERVGVSTPFVVPVRSVARYSGSSFNDMPREIAHTTCARSV